MPLPSFTARPYHLIAFYYSHISDLAGFLQHYLPHTNHLTAPFVSVVRSECCPPSSELLTTLQR